MGKLIVSLEGVVIKEVELTKEKTTLGRRPYNDIVIDNLAVSGEHAVLQKAGNDVFIEDLNSTNGTYINGKAVKKQLLSHNDSVEIGKYKIKYLVDDGGGYEKTQVFRADASATGAHSSFNPSGLGNLSGSVAPASIKVLNGAAAGREMVLTKVVTTVGKPGVQVASITKRPNGYLFAHVDGANRPLVNGQPLVGETAPLKNGDVIELAGTQMQFVQA
ncbi:FHA domain-containing protein [Piscinibacter sakaiensis]|uniref:FHA domain-containing protein n=1 Tax=Piscinibacter sakaiensis TaxID=1547922 RepID=UPI003AABAC19